MISDYINEAFRNRHLAKLALDGQIVLEVDEDDQVSYIVAKKNLGRTISRWLFDVWGAILLASLPILAVGYALSSYYPGIVWFTAGLTSFILVILFYLWRSK